MTGAGTVTYWLNQLKVGDATAAQKLWESYFQRLLELARTKLRNVPRQMADEEDVALSAFHSFYRGATEGRFPQLDDREDLWRLLVTLIARKAANLIQHEHRHKRGGGKVLRKLDNGRKGKATIKAKLTDGLGTVKVEKLKVKLRAAGGR